MPSHLLGTSVSGKPGEAAKREAAAQASLAALAGVECVNLAFHDDPPGAGILPQRRALKQDAPGVTGVPGPRKPVVSEMLDVLAAAAERGIPRIGLVNGDIVVLPAAIDRLSAFERPAAAVARTDVGAGQPEAIMHFGIDMFVFDRGFWARERRRFRRYLLGEIIWDNVYASIVACHGGAILNQERLMLHERHERAATLDSPFDVYLHGLATRDRSYFTLWCTYVDRAELLRARGGSAEEDQALQREIFAAPSRADNALDRGRAAWWSAKRMLGA